MSEMYFKSILIADLNKKEARFQDFKKGFNVITSHDNHMGKSSLLKSLYYAMGAEIEYDDIWDKKSKLYIVDIMVNDKKYKIARFQKTYAVFEEDNLVLLTQSASKDLAKKYEEIFSFAVYLPNKKTNKIELAPPVFTFLPYYIDQDDGWSGLYNSFSNINQYDKKEREKSLYYHLKIYDKDTIELMAKRDKIIEIKEKHKEKERKISITLENLEEEVQNLLPAENIEELERNLTIPKKQISILVNKVGDLRNEIQLTESKLLKYEHQLNIVKEYNKLKKSNESQFKLHTCPSCGYTFDEELYEIVRSNYNVQNEDYMCAQIQLLINSISDELKEYKEKYVNAMNELKTQEKVYNETCDCYEVYVRQRGLEGAINNLNIQLRDYINQQDQCEKEIKEIKKILRKLPNKKEIEEEYIEKVRENIIKLGAWNQVYDKKIKLVKPIKGQGALENKIILAQVVGLFQTMDILKIDTAWFPFVVDSPRANEASLNSSKEIIGLVSELNMPPQVILSTIDCDDYKSDVKCPTYVTEYSDKYHLLNDKTYEVHQKDIEEIFSLLKNV